MISMSLSLIAVFLPILMTGGLVGRLFQEFAVTLSLAILISLVALADHDADDVRPAAPARDARPRAAGSSAAGRRLRAARSGSTSAPSRSACAISRLVMLILLATVGLNVYLYVIVPKGFFPEQDTGQMMGGIQADQRISFQAMEQKLRQPPPSCRRTRRWTASWASPAGRGTNSPTSSSA